MGLLYGAGNFGFPRPQGHVSPSSLGNSGQRGAPGSSAHGTNLLKGTRTLDAQGVTRGLGLQDVNDSLIIH